jgi:hypothetical protein
VARNKVRLFLNSNPTASINKWEPLACILKLIQLQIKLITEKEDLSQEIQKAFHLLKIIELIIIKERMLLHQLQRQEETTATYKTKTSKLQITISYRTTLIRSMLCPTVITDLNQLPTVEVPIDRIPKGTAT